MKTTKLLLAALLLAASVVSCTDDKDTTPNTTVTDADLPSFSTLYQYLGRTDFDAIVEELTDDGYNVSREMYDNYGHIEGEKGNYLFELEFENRKVAFCHFYYRPTTVAEGRRLFQAKMNDEMQFMHQSELQRYKGAFSPVDESSAPEAYYSSKAALIAALPSLDLSGDIELESHSIYPDLVTVVGYRHETLFYSVHFTDNGEDPEEPEEPSVPDGIHVTFDGRTWTAVQIQAQYDTENNYINLAAYERANGYDHLIAGIKGLIGSGTTTLEVGGENEDEEIQGYNNDRTRYLKYYTKDVQTDYGENADWWGYEFSIDVTKLDTDNGTFSARIQGTMFNFEEWYEVIAPNVASTTKKSFEIFISNVNLTM